MLGKVEERERSGRGGLRPDEGRGAPGGGSLLGESEPMRALMRQVERLAPVSTTVLITGESGTGKELVARALHGHSPARRRGPSSPSTAAPSPRGCSRASCSATRGAPSPTRAPPGAASSGRPTAARSSSTRWASCPLAAQVKLLRALQEGEIRPVGDSRAERVDVRVVAATLRDLDRLVERGEFREDLYYRLNVVNVRVPPLRERREDIPLLAARFLERFNRELQRASPLLGLSPEALAVLAAYAWPGNVRELENAMERAVLLAEGPWVLPQNLPERL